VVRRTLVLPPHSEFSNLGDQAILMGLITVYTRQIKGRVTVVFPNKSKLAEPIQEMESVECIFVPKQGGLRQLLRSFMQMALIMIRISFDYYDDIVYAGADVLDGRYGPVMKMRLHRYVFKCIKATGRAIKFASFSYNRTRSDGRSKFLKLFVKNGLFYPRGSVSLEELRLFMPQCNAILTADASFSLPVDKVMPNLGTPDFPGGIRGGKKVLVCPANRGDQPLSGWISDLAATIDALHYDYTYIVVHDLGHEPSIFDDLSSRLSTPHAVIRSHDVRVIRSLSSQCELVVSCLMHCSLGGVAAGTPSVTLDYGDKAFNMFRDMGLEDMVAKDPAEFLKKILEFKDMKLALSDKLAVSASQASVRAGKILDDLHI
jgi:polysaccharide pyruvyl transferase WcaK-like protein